MYFGDEVMDLKALPLRGFTEIFSYEKMGIQPHTDHMINEPGSKLQL